MAEFPLEPQLSKMLIAAVDQECGDEMLTLGNNLQVDTLIHYIVTKYVDHWNLIS